MSTVEATRHFLTYWHDIEKALNLIKNETRRITEARAKEVGRPLSAKLQLHKIIEEIFETRQEAKSGTPEKEIDETLDIFFAWIGFVHLRHFTDDEIMWGVQRSLKKFNERGWIEFK